MREKAEVTEEAQALIEQVIRDMGSPEAAVRMKAQDQVRRLTHLYGKDALEAVEMQLAEQAWDSRQAEMDDSIVWD